MGSILLHAQGIIWEKNFGGTANDFGYASLPTPDGGYIVAGYTNSSATGDVTGTSPKTLQKFCR